MTSCQHWGAEGSGAWATFSIGFFDAETVDQWEREGCFCPALLLTHFFLLCCSLEIRSTLDMSNKAGGKRVTTTNSDLSNHNMVSEVSTERPSVRVSDPYMLGNLPAGPPWTLHRFPGADFRGAEGEGWREGLAQDQLGAICFQPWKFSGLYHLWVLQSGIPGLFLSTPCHSTAL